MSSKKTIVFESDSSDEDHDVDELRIGSPLGKKVDEPWSLEKRPFLQTKRSSRYYRKFVTTRLPKDFVRPIEKKRPIHKFAHSLPWIAAGLGILMILGGAYWGYSLVPKHEFKQVIWYEDFSSNKLDLENDFNREVSFGGFGATSLEWNTDFDNNSFVQDHQLHIQALMTPPFFNTEGTNINLTAEGRCTVNYTESDCVATRNESRGSYFNAITSARLTTKGKHTMRYGRLEVSAKMPLGKWLWPALWLLPQSTDNYGMWPASGEIDLIESKGNPIGYPGGGYNTMQSSVHQAPVGSKQSNGGIGSNPHAEIPFSMLPLEFHTYGMDWTPQGIICWIDNPLYQIVNWKFRKDPFNNFDLQPMEPVAAGSKVLKRVYSPWTVSNHKSAPFDEPFYLIMNVAVGRGYFAQTPDMPYPVDADFWNAQRGVWMDGYEMNKTWGKSSALVIDSIKMTALDNLAYWENLPSALYDNGTDHTISKR